MITQHVLIKLLRATCHIVYVPNHKFDEMLLIIGKNFTHLKTQAPTVEAYDALSKQINTSFQRVFKRLSELQSEDRLASDAGPSSARRGEVRERERDITIQWKSFSDFTLHDESSHWAVEILEPIEKDDEEEEDLIENAVLGLQAIMEQSVKPIYEVEKNKCSSVSWPSSLHEAFKRSREMDKLTVDAFRATQSMLPPIPAPRIP